MRRPACTSRSIWVLSPSSSPPSRTTAAATFSHSWITWDTSGCSLGTQGWFGEGLQPGHTGCSLGTQGCSCHHTPRVAHLGRELEGSVRSLQCAQQRSERRLELRVTPRCLARRRLRAQPLAVGARQLSHVGR